MLWEDEKLGRGHDALTRWSHDAKSCVERHERDCSIRWMHNMARASAEDGVELIFAGGGKTGVAAVFEAGEAIAKIPAPWALAHITRQRADIADLRCRHSFGGFGQHGILAANYRMPAESVERDEPPNSHASRVAPGERYLIQTLDGFQVDEHVRRNDALFH